MEHNCMIIVLAQKALTFQDIVSKLLPRGGIEFVYDLFLYVIFFLAVIAMFMQSDKQTFPTILMAAVAAFAVIAKLNVLTPKAFGTLIINIGMGVIPLIVAGITKAKKSQPLVIIGGVVGMVYFIMFWLISQRGG
jgi:hypothetical protein